MKDRKIYLRQLYEVNQKIYRIQNFDRLRINEGKLSILSEAVDDKDMDKLRGTVAAFRKACVDCEKQLGTVLKGVVSEEPEAEAAYEKLSTYLKSVAKSLVDLEKSTANADFESGKIKSSIAGNVTIPALVAVTTQQIASLESFLTSFEKYKQKVVRSLVPLSKDDGKSLAQQQELETKMPDKEKMIAFASEVFQKEKKVGFFSKVKTFFKTLLSGEARGIASKFPKYDPDALGEALAILFINTKTGTLKALKPYKIPSAKDAGSAANAAREESVGGTSGGGDSDEGEIGEGGLSPSQVAYLKKMKGDLSNKEFGDILRDEGLVESRKTKTKLLNEDTTVSRWKVLAGIKEEI